MPPWLRYLIAFVVGCHGFTYIPFGILVPGTLKEWRGSSWLLGRTLTGGRLKALVLTLHVMAGIALLACGVTVGVVRSIPGLWCPLAIVGAMLGIAGFAVFWDGQTKLLVLEGAIGAVISLILLVSAIAFAGAFS